jgi:drug/metabolite transporter (DMT)-like permease
MVAALLTTVLFALSVIFGTRAARVLGGTTANFWRLLIATLLLAIWAHGKGVGILGKAFPIFLVSGCVGFGLGDLAMFQAMTRLGSRLTLVLVQCLAAPFGAATEWLWLGTTLSGWQILCGGVILVGVALALSPEQGESSTGAEFPYDKNALAVRTPPPGLPPGVLWSGAFFAVVAAFGQGFGAVISRKAFAVAALAGQSIDGITAAYQRILGGLAIGGLAYALLRLTSKARNASSAATKPANSVRAPNNWPRVWPWVLLNGLAGPTLGVSCFQWALKTTPAGIVLPIVATTPLVGIPLAYFIEGDRARPRALIGGVIAVIGAVALTRAR